MSEGEYLNFGTITLNQLEMALTYVGTMTVGTICVAAAVRLSTMTWKKAKALDTLKALETKAAFEREYIPQHEPTLAEANDMRILNAALDATEFASTNMPDSRVAYDWGVQATPLPEAGEHKEQ